MVLSKSGYTKQYYVDANNFLFLIFLISRMKK